MEISFFLDSPFLLLKRERRGERKRERAEFFCFFLFFSSAAALREKENTKRALSLSPLTIVPMNSANSASRCLTPSLSTYSSANDDAALATMAAGSDSAPFESNVKARAEPTTSWTSAPTIATSAASQRARRAGLAYSRLCCGGSFFF